MIIPQILTIILLWPNVATIDAPENPGEHGRVGATTSPAHPELDKDIIAAAGLGHLPEIRSLIRRGGNPSAATKDRTTALIEAIVFDHDDVAEFLIRSGADVHASVRFGTALHWAALTHRTAIAKLLIASGADIRAVSPEGGTPLHRACEGGAGEIVQLLVESGVDVNARDRHGATPLSRVIIFAPFVEGPENIIRYLIGKGARVDAADEKGQTPMSLARERGMGDVADQMVELQRNFDAQKSKDRKKRVGGN
jgi:ankyrin repeat protein